MGAPADREFHATVTVASRAVDDDPTAAPAPVLRTARDHVALNAHTYVDDVHRVLHTASLRFRTGQHEPAFHFLEWQQFNVLGRVPCIALSIVCIGLAILALLDENLNAGPAVLAVALVSVAGVCIGAVTLCGALERVQRLGRSEWWSPAAATVVTFQATVVCLLSWQCAYHSEMATLECSTFRRGEAPVLPFLLVVIAPWMLRPLFRARWYHATASAFLLAAVAAISIVPFLRPAVVGTASVTLCLNAVFVALSAWSHERASRSAFWYYMNSQQSSSGRERVERPLRALDLLLRRMGHVVYQVNSLGMVGAVSSAVMPMLGYSPSEMVGKKHLSRVHPKDKRVVATALQTQWRQAGEKELTPPLFMQFRRTSRSGETVWVELVSTIGCVDNGGPQMIICERSVTAEKHAVALAQRERAGRKKAEAEKAVHEGTLGYACHELRNPLHVIHASMDVIKDYEDDLDEPGRKCLAAVLASVHQMRTLVDDILDINKLRAGKMAIRSAMFSPATLVQDAAEHHVSFASVPITCTIEPDVPPVVIAPGVRIRQVVNNGFTNAAKFTKKGWLNVRLMLAPTRSNFLRVELTNTGSGLGTDDPESLFEEYTQGNNQEEASAAGTGLGLPICRKLVTAMGGEIGLMDINRDDRLITMFWFEVPYKAVGEDTEGAHPTLRASLTHGTSSLDVLSIDSPSSASGSAGAGGRRTGTGAGAGAGAGTGAGAGVMARSALSPSSSSGIRGSPRAKRTVSFKIDAEARNTGVAAARGGPGLPPPARRPPLPVPAKPPAAAAATLSGVSWPVHPGPRSGSGSGSGSGPGPGPTPVTGVAGSSGLTGPGEAPGAGAGAGPAPLVTSLRAADGAPGEVAAVGVAGTGRPAPARGKKSKRKKGRRPKLPPLNLRVLVVDDTRMSLRMTSSIVEASGCVADTATDGDEVLPLLQKETFDVVLMDIEMQRMNGDAACEQVRAAGFTLPIVAVTGHAGWEERLEKCGFTSTLVKPFTRSDVRKLLEHIAAARPGGAAAAAGDPDPASGAGEPTVAAPAPAPAPAPVSAVTQLVSLPRRSGTLTSVPEVEEESGTSDGDRDRDHHAGDRATAGDTDVATGIGAVTLVVQGAPSTSSVSPATGSDGHLTSMESVLSTDRVILG